MASVIISESTVPPEGQFPNRGSVPERDKAMPRPWKAIVPPERIERGISLVRGHRVLLSPDLGKLYRVETRALVQAVKRNVERFPRHFVFQLSPAELANLKSQTVISGWGGALGGHSPEAGSWAKVCPRSGGERK